MQLSCDFKILSECGKLCENRLDVFININLHKSQDTITNDPTLWVMEQEIPMSPSQGLPIIRIIIITIISSSSSFRMTVTVYIKFSVHLFIGRPSDLLPDGL